MLIAAFLPVLSTLLGGLAVLRFRHRLHPIMAFAAGVLLGTALLELLPESYSLVASTAEVPPLMLTGLLAYTALANVTERMAYEHQHKSSSPNDKERSLSHSPDDADKQSLLGLLGPIGLVFHSSMDGVAIGLGFNASAEVGLIVTLAVVGHDFADGLNVVTLALAGGVSQFRARALLVADALVVPVGVFFGAHIGIDRHILGLLLAVFAGGFIAIGAGHLLPEAQHENPEAGLKMAAFAMVGVIAVVIIRLIAGSV